MSLIKTALTIKGIKDSEVFFEVVNQCLEPIRIQVPGGELKDLRDNILVQNYLTWLSPTGAIECVEVFCQNEEDIERLLKFMEEY